MLLDPGYAGDPDAIDHHQTAWFLDTCGRS